MEEISLIRKQLNLLEKKFKKLEENELNNRLFSKEPLTVGLLKKLDYDWDNIKGDWDGPYGNFYIYAKYKETAIYINCNLYDKVYEDIEDVEDIDNYSHNIDIGQKYLDTLDEFPDDKKFPIGLSGEGNSYYVENGDVNVNIII